MRLCLQLFICLTMFWVVVGCSTRGGNIPEPEIEVRIINEKEQPEQTPPRRSVIPSGRSPVDSKESQARTNTILKNDGMDVRRGADGSIIISPEMPPDGVIIGSYENDSTFEYNGTLEDFFNIGETEIIEEEIWEEPEIPSSLWQCSYLKITIIGTSAVHVYSHRDNSSTITASTSNQQLPHYEIIGDLSNTLRSYAVGFNM